jgi:uncharacterized protein (DUF4415 family)
MTVKSEILPQEWVDPDDAPDLSTPYWQAEFAKAKLVRGRPKLGAVKQSTTIRLDADILRQFRAQGPRWQSRINEVLKEYLARG